MDPRWWYLLIFVWLGLGYFIYRFSQVALYKQAFNSLNKMKRVMNLKIKIKSFKDISWFVCSWYHDEWNTKRIIYVHQWKKWGKHDSFFRLIIFKSSTFYRKRMMNCVQIRITIKIILLTRITEKLFNLNIVIFHYGHGNSVKWKATIINLTIKFSWFNLLNIWDFSENVT